MKQLGHEAVARLALARGFLDRTTYSRVIAALSRHELPHDSEAIDAFWIEGGWLKREQLDELLARTPTRVHPVTAPIGGEPERSTLARADTAAMPVRPRSFTPPPPGTTARYEPGRLIGTGGMGDVFEARDTHLGRRVALKVPRSDADGSVPHLLAREARVAGSLEHPGIVPVYDAGEREGVGPFYAMRLLEQPTLEDVIARLSACDRDAERDYGLGRLLRYYVQICQAVDYAHSRGVVHCDLKPGNVVVGEFGEVVILDWGMAFKVEEGLRNRGGTPGYMAPEQARTDTPVDRRADIFGLGAILYEILALQPAYGDGITDLVMRCAAGQAVMQPPIPPRARRPSIAEELEQICLRAMQVDPAERHGSARELAADVEAFLEGTKERERRNQRASGLVQQGDQLAEMYGEYVESRPRLVEEAARIRAGIAAWEPSDRKRELWDAEDRLSATDAVGVRTFQAAVAAYEQALDEQPGFPAARRGLASLYATEVKRARERRDELNRIYFEELVKQFSDGSPALLARNDGRLRIRGIGGEVDVFVADYEEQDRRFQPVRERPLGRTPLEKQLPAGTYVLRIVDRLGASHSCPIQVAPDRDTELELEAEVLASLDPGERYVPGGVALLGGDDLSPWGRELRAVHVPSFVIAEKPVSFAEYLAFAEGVVRAGEDVTAFLPVNALGVPHWRWEGDAFVLTTNFDVDRDELLTLPAVGVSRAAAEAYCAWRILRTGRTYRLPREDEWEKAARGVDGRAYPWGDYFDASFCKMVQSRPGAARPERAGAFPADVSPYGVRDMAGSIADWVVEHAPGASDLANDGAVDIARGGAWCDWRADCHLATRRPYPPGAQTSRVGFRLVRDP
jgi:serine/threonine-protein kinase